MRINKYLSECGVCSRREADILIENGDVLVNGEPAIPGVRIGSGDIVKVKDKIVNIVEKTYLAFNKPKGIVCTSEKREPNNLIDYLGYHKRITYAGRLDKDSEGLLILTDDGNLIDALMTGSNGHEKEYVVRVARDLTDEKLKRLEKGVYLSEINRKTKPCKVRRSGEFEFHITLTQGINRQIRRMCKNVGLRVVFLKRIRIANIKLGELGSGEYRELTDSEIKELRKLTEMTGRSNLR